MAPPSPDPSWLSGFSPFTLHHLVVITASTLVAAWVIRLGVGHRGTPFERRIRWAWGLTTAASALGMTIFWTMPQRYRPDTSWPFHLCDLAAWFAPYAMLTARRWPKTILFFWGVALSSQGFVTPTVRDGLLSAGYWLFWVQHLGVVAGGLYLAVVNGYRPRWRDALFAAALTVALGLVMAAFNLAFDTNYMYTGNMTPQRPTLIDHLGPWPLRLVWLSGLVFLACLLTQSITMLVLGLARTSTLSPPGGERAR